MTPPTSLADDRATGRARGRDGPVTANQVDALEHAVLTALAELSAQVAAIEAKLDALGPPVDARHAEFFTAIARALEDRDLPFDVHEVVAAARSDHRLDRALHALNATTVPRLGALLRTLRGRTFAGLRLTRVGRDWQLDRT